MEIKRYAREFEMPGSRVVIVTLPESTRNLSDAEIFEKYPDIADFMERSGRERIEADGRDEGQV